MNNKQEMEQIEKTIGKILRVGVAVSATFMIVGLLMFFITGSTGYSQASQELNSDWPRNITAIFSGVFSLKPVALMMLGLLLLIFTPVLRVIASIFSFAFEKDRLYVYITLTVLAILLLAIFVGYHSR